MQSLDEQRIEALQEALIEYVGRYGLTELAIRAFRICAMDDEPVDDAKNMSLPKEDADDLPSE